MNERLFVSKIVFAHNVSRMYFSGDFLYFDAVSVLLFYSQSVIPRYPQ